MEKATQICIRCNAGLCGEFCGGMAIICWQPPTPTQKTEVQQQIVITPNVNVNFTLHFNSNNVNNNAVSQPKLGGAPKAKKKSTKKRR